MPPFNETHAIEMILRKLDSMDNKLNTLTAYAAADHQRIKSLESFRKWGMTILGTLIASGSAFTAYAKHFLGGQ